MEDGRKPAKIPLDDSVTVTELETEAVVKIQSTYRGHKARKEVKDMIAGGGQS